MDITFCFLLFHLVLRTAYSDCSQKCQSSEDTPAAELNNSTSNKLLPFPCSCSPSCSVYGDCCYDSLHRDSSRRVAPSDTMCLLVEGAGHFRAVAKCPGKWPGGNLFCGESIGFQPPVTSKTTGITYANVHCAVCHEDAENLVSWNVELSCCTEHENERDRYYSYRETHLWSRLRRGGRRCLCRYRPHYNSTDFLSGLELRDCRRNREISACSSSWIGEREKRLCPLYLDPVYAGDHVYKNPHCATCNFEDDTQCVPAVVARMVTEGVDLAEITRHCQGRKMTVCLHYMQAVEKGRKFSFDSFMRISSSSCWPDAEKNCPCKGYQYNYKAKKCKEVYH